MSKSNQFELLKTKRFAPFFWTQFLGAFNDNAYKNSLVILIAYQAINLTTISSDYLINLCAGIFILPFFIFSATAGQLADKYEKARLIRYIKILEIVIMLCAAIGFYFNSVPFLIFVLFLLGSQSAFFGPVKYGILPQQLDETELVGGNGLVEMGTFLAILLGTIFGGVLISVTHIGPLIVSLSIITVAVLGYTLSRFIPKANPVDSNLKICWNPVRQTWRNISFARENRTVFLSILGNSWFWFYGSVFLAQIPMYSKVFLGGSEHVVTLLLVMFSIGIGIGSLLCERLSGHKIEIGLVPFGSIGLSVFAISLYFIMPHAHVGPEIDVVSFFKEFKLCMVLLNLMLLGVFGGFYIVPLYALIQNRSKATHRSRIIAGNNILNALLMVVAAIYAIALLRLGVTIPQLFLITGLLNIVVASYIYTLVPEFLMRFLIWIMVNLLYRIKTENLENAIPEEGAAVLVCNHISFVDALVIAACVRRPIRFVMDHNIFKKPVLRFIFKTANAIPIAPAKENAAMKERAFDEIAKGLENGDLIMIFPEGGITRDGELKTFRPGIDQIIKRTPVPVIPLALRGLWGSFFSRKDGPAMSSWPKRLWSKIALVAGDPVAPENVSAASLEATVLALRGMEK